MLTEDFLRCLVCFQHCFTAPSFQRFLTVMAGWILCTAKHTITGVIRAAGVVGVREHGGYHRFFNTAAWSADDVGLALMGLIVTMFPKTATVRLTVDDTLARHTGKRIEAAAMHHDPLLSWANKPFFHFGHQWVVLAVVVPFVRWGKVFSLPVLVRLLSSKKFSHLQEFGVPLYFVFPGHEHFCAIRLTGLNIHPDIERCFYYKIRCF